MSVQLEDLAFDIAGHAYEHRISDRVQNQVLRAYAPSSRNYRQQLSTLLKQSAESRPSITPTLREVEGNQTDVDVQEYLLIGLVPSDNSLKTLASMPKGQKGKAVGLERPAAVMEPSDDEPPLRVVTPISDHNPDGGIKLYVLIEPKSDLCHAYNVAQKEVFYFSEYRDEATNSEGRKRSWNDRVRAKAVRVRADASLSERQAKFKRARDTTKITIDASASFVNDLVALTTAFSMHQDPWILRQIQNVLELADEDLTTLPFLPTDSLRAFVGRGGDFGSNEAVRMIEQVKSLWPDVEMSVEVVLALKQGLDESGIAVQYRFLRGFLVYGAQRVSDGMDGEVKMKDLVVEVRNTVARIVGDVTPTRPSVRADQAGALINAIREKLKDVRSAAMRYSQQLRDLNGDQVVATALPDIWESYRHASDTDSAKLAFHQALRYAFAALTLKTDHLEAMIGNIIELLDHLR